MSDDLLTWCRRVLEQHRRDFPADFAPGGKHYETPASRDAALPKKKLARKGRRRKRARA
jgi:hypothetical protein